MGQYVVRAIIIPALEYCLLGIPLTEEELRKVCAPVMRKLRHCYTVHASFPSPFFHHPQGARVPWLVTRHDGMLLTAHRRLMNGEGAPCFAALAAALHDATAQSLCFPGDVLAHPEHAATITQPGRGPKVVLLHLAHRLAHRGLAIREPRAATDAPRMLLDLLPPPGQKTPLRSLHASGWRTIRDAVTALPAPAQAGRPAGAERQFTVRNGQTRATLAHQFVRDVTRRAYGLHGASASPDPDAVANRTLIGGAMAPAPAAATATSAPFTLEALRERLWTPAIAAAVADCVSVSAYTDGSLTVVDGAPS
ncbi:hypothetical protein H4R21_004017, partial [Coemansia helicoidea]